MRNNVNNENNNDNSKEKSTNTLTSKQQFIIKLAVSVGTIIYAIIELIKVIKN